MTHEDEYKAWTLEMTAPFWQAQESRSSVQDPLSLVDTADPEWSREYDADVFAEYLFAQP
jgi:hypothetical protein